MGTRTYHDSEYYIPLKILSFFLYHIMFEMITKFNLNLNGSASSNGIGEGGSVGAKAFTLAATNQSHMHRLHIFIFPACLHIICKVSIFPPYKVRNETCFLKTQHISLIAFGKRVTFLALTHLVTALCMCVFIVALSARRLAYNHYAIAHAYNAANMHAQGSDPTRWSQNVTLSSKAIGV